MLDPLIRTERTTDRAAVFDINFAAFGRPNEARLVDALRESADFVPDLSLVAEVAGRIVGHILLTPIAIETDGGDVSTLLLAPMAVHPDHQRRGTGSALVRAGLKAGRRLGHSAVLVVGHPRYYPRFGFIPVHPPATSAPPGAPAIRESRRKASARGGRRCDISLPFICPDEAFMLCELVPGALDGVRGGVRLPPAFDEVQP